MTAMRHDAKPREHHGGGNHYLKLLVMIVLAFVAMYALMYSMVNAFANVYGNLNQVSMAALMAAPMVTIELIVMGGMYPNKRLNMALAVSGVVVTGLCFLAIRSQAGISDRQFLRSMIPHHAGAILMCQEARITDRSIQALCREILSSQQREITQMKSLLGEPQQ